MGMRKKLGFLLFGFLCKDILLLSLPVCSCEGQNIHKEERKCLMLYFCLTPCLAYLWWVNCRHSVPDRRHFEVCEQTKIMRKPKQLEEQL